MSVCLWSTLFRAGWKVEILGRGVSFARYCPLGRFTSHILWAGGADWTDFLRESFDLRGEEGKRLN